MFISHFAPRAPQASKGRQVAAAPSLGSASQPVDRFAPTIDAEIPTRGSRGHKDWMLWGASAILACSALLGPIGLAQSSAVECRADIHRPTVVEKVLQQDEVLAAQFEALPREIQNAAICFSDGQVEMLKSGTEGESWVGILRVDHKEAFINGEAWGQDAWPHIRQEISEAHSKWDLISEVEVKELHQVIDTAASLSKGQRAEIADLLQALPQP